MNDQTNRELAHEMGLDCEVEYCQDCCSHDERDHGICLDCGDEDDGSGDIDAAMDFLEDK